MKGKTNHVRAGNGRDCITHPDHGASIVLPTGQEWCPSQVHDGSPLRDGKQLVPPTTPWLTRQEAADEDRQADSA